ncbi:RNA-directed RNA polymerase [ssRNA phage Gerhypos.2_39]|uniref:RNA-directed RNA polymerase n=2 Tax=Leviviricetes TaxID=2842243 RepID=A0A8S5L3W3_9VIRU|nr:RNA-directed RNA polymerase [ssRNA phage Gerhypos.2_39]QDH89563.1 MAG: RNA-dependent RNA polymerase [Leviviridae sp.]DAD52203.1 TPA_asm: RNA-directed RNA polymerase [ssRNA phage Gerhypos.2_39]
MKSLMSLWSQLAEESANLCCTSASQDINTVLARVEHEGLSFLTITLPDLGKATQKWLDQGHAGIHSSFRSERGGSFPRFLGGFFNRVFDRRSGVLLDEPCIDSIRAIRQLTLMFGKMELECSKTRRVKAIRNYIKCEQEVRLFDSEISKSDLADFQDMSNMLFRSVFTKVDRDIYYGRIVPKHGPGSTADGLTGNRKYLQAVWTDRLEAVFPAYANLIPNWNFSSELDKVTYLEPGAEMPVKVILVPKTLKTPRVIAMEPTCMQYMQQGILRSFLEHFYRDDFLRKVIGFDDQTPNQELARSGSLDQRTATLDLSDASDRVSNQLVRTMLSDWPHFKEAVDATRSRRAVLPDKSIIRLAKFASMGSALCFPVEAMVFTTLIFLGIQKSLNTPLNRRSLREFSDSVRVYGDDLIVPVDHVPSVVQTLEHFGARVGLDKSFWTGKFRESCGREYFNGHDVSITRVRQVFPTQRSNVTGVESLVSLRNQLYHAGYWQTCDWLDGRIRRVLKHYPIVLSTSPVLGRESVLGYQSEKTHPYLHSPLVKGYVRQAKPPLDHLEGSGALLKCLLKLDTDAWLRGYVPWHQSSTFDSKEPDMPWAPPMVLSDHLERYGRPKSSSLKLRWRSPF